MSTKAKMQMDPSQGLMSCLAARAWNHDLLAEYVSQLSRNKHEEEIFRLLAFRQTNPACEDLLKLYERASFEEKTNLRRQRHDEAHREAFKHDDLRALLSWRYLV